MNYIPKNQRYTLYKLSNDVTSLVEVQEKILQRTHRAPLHIKNISDETLLDDRTFLYKWINASSTEDNIIFEATDQSFSYLKVTASCEFSTRRVLNPETGDLLPKEERLNTSIIDCLFVQLEQELYVVIFTNSFYDLRRVKRLISEEFLEPLTAKHQTDSELFHWLFYKFIKEEYDLNSEIEIDNINGFTGTVISEDHLFEGNSIQTAELIITKAFITNGHPITSLKVDLQMPDAAINFYLSEVSEGKELKIVVEKNSSISTLLNNEDIEYVVPIYIFFYLIPEVIKLYKVGEKNFLSNDKNNFLSEIGIEVIKTIMAKNNLEISDIE